MTPHLLTPLFFPLPENKYIAVFRANPCNPYGRIKHVLVWVTFFTFTCFTVLVTNYLGGGSTPSTGPNQTSLMQLIVAGFVNSLLTAPVVPVLNELATGTALHTQLMKDLSKLKEEREKQKRKKGEKEEGQGAIEDENDEIKDEKDPKKTALVGNCERWEENYYIVLCILGSCSLWFLPFLLYKASLPRASSYIRVLVRLRYWNTLFVSLLSDELKTLFMSFVNFFLIDSYKGFFIFPSVRLGEQSKLVRGVPHLLSCVKLNGNGPVAKIYRPREAVEAQYKSARWMPGRVVEQWDEQKFEVEMGTLTVSKNGRDKKFEPFAGISTFIVDPEGIKLVQGYCMDDGAEEKGKEERDRDEEEEGGCCGGGKIVKRKFYTSLVAGAVIKLPETKHAPHAQQHRSRAAFSQTARIVTVIQKGTYSIKYDNPIDLNRPVEYGVNCLRIRKFCEGATILGNQDYEGKANFEDAIFSDEAAKWHKGTIVKGPYRSKHTSFKLVDIRYDGDFMGKEGLLSPWDSVVGRALLKKFLGGLWAGVGELSYWEEKSQWLQYKHKYFKQIGEKHKKVQTKVCTVEEICAAVNRSKKVKKALESGQQGLQAMKVGKLVVQQLEEVDYDALVGLSPTAWISLCRVLNASKKAIKAEGGDNESGGETEEDEDEDEDEEQKGEKKKRSRMGPGSQRKQGKADEKTKLKATQVKVGTKFRTINKDGKEVDAVVTKIRSTTGEVLFEIDAPPNLTLDLKTFLKEEMKICETHAETVELIKDVEMIMKQEMGETADDRAERQRLIELAERLRLQDEAFELARQEHELQQQQEFERIRRNRLDLDSLRARAAYVTDVFRDGMSRIMTGRPLPRAERTFAERPIDSLRARATLMTDAFKDSISHIMTGEPLPPDGAHSHEENSHEDFGHSLGAIHIELTRSPVHDAAGRTGHDTPRTSLSLRQQIQAPVPPMPPHLISSANRGSMRRDSIPTGANLDLDAPYMQAYPEAAHISTENVMRHESSRNSRSSRSSRGSLGPTSYQDVQPRPRGSFRGPEDRM